MVIKTKFVTLYLTKKIHKDVEISMKIQIFCETFSKSQSSKNLNETETFSCTFNNDQINLYEKNLSETDLYQSNEKYAK